MLLGISYTLPHRSPEEWAQKNLALGLSSVVFPCDFRADTAAIDGYARAAEAAGLCIAEVGAWSNPVSPDKKIAAEALSLCRRQLELAEYVGARCCVNIAGASGELWDGGYAENYSEATYERIVCSLRDIIDFVKPVKTRYALEPMPYILPDSPESCLRLLSDVDRPGLAVHMDAVNLINSPDRYFKNREFVTHCFELLGKMICSCHIKDTLLEHALTLSIREVECGAGGFDIAHLCAEIDRTDPAIPALIEHLPDEASFLRAVKYVQSLRETENEK